MHRCKGKKLTRWSEFTDHQSRSGSECGKAGPDKLEPEAPIWWDQKHGGGKGIRSNFLLHPFWVEAGGAVCI